MAMFVGSSGFFDSRCDCYVIVLRFVMKNFGFYLFNRIAAIFLG